MAKTRATSIPEWTIKPMKRRAVRLCDVCFKSNRRCQDSTRRGYKPSDSWKNHIRKQWWPKR